MQGRIITGAAPAPDEVFQIVAGKYSQLNQELVHLVPAGEFRNQALCRLQESWGWARQALEVEQAGQALQRAALNPKPGS